MQGRQDIDSQAKAAASAGLAFEGQDALLAQRPEGAGSRAGIDAQLFGYPAG
jgi:hypothetical protein